MEKDLKKYEIGFLAVSEEARNSVVEALKNYKAEIFDEGNFTKIKLAYPVKKQTSAFFGYIQFSAAPSVISALKDSLKLNSQILRFIVILPSTKAIPTKTKAVRQVLEKPEFKEFKKVEIKKPKPQPTLSNEDLEKKLEEILK